MMSIKAPGLQAARWGISEMQGGSMGQQSKPGRPRWGQKLRGASPAAGRDELVTGAVPEAQAGDSTGRPAGSATAEHPAMAGQPAANPVAAGQPAATGVSAPEAVAV